MTSTEQLARCPLCGRAIKGSLMVGGLRIVACDCVAPYDGVRVVVPPPPPPDEEGAS